MHHQRFWLVALALLLLMSSGVAIRVTTAHRAQPVYQSAPAAFTDAEYAIAWDVMGGGGGEMSSTSYRLRGTIGQPAIGTAQSENFALRQGFWQQFLNTIRTYLPSIQK